MWPMEVFILTGEEGISANSAKTLKLIKYFIKTMNQAPCLSNGIVVQ